MTDRGSQDITWDVENRPVTVTGGATFYYDGDGNRYKKTENDETTVYVNQYYEKNLDAETATSYYYLGGRLVVLKKGENYSMVSQDHLSSTSTTLDISGQLESSVSYEPFGLTRSSSGTVPTDKLFTGQRLDGTGLYFYNARYYDPTIGRFISPDSIVPNFVNPQSFNRYSYVLNNPLRYNDPTGAVQMDIGGGFVVNVDPSVLDSDLAALFPGLAAALAGAAGGSGTDPGTTPLCGPPPVHPPPPTPPPPPDLSSSHPTSGASQGPAWEAAPPATPSGPAWRAAPPATPTPTAKASPTSLAAALRLAADVIDSMDTSGLSPENVAYAVFVTTGTVIAPGVGALIILGVVFGQWLVPYILRWSADQLDR